MLELGRHFIAGDIGRLPAESGSYRRPTPEPKDGEFLVRITHLSFDPTQRGWISRDSYVPAVPLGAVVRAAGAGRVVRSRHPDFREGELVQGSFGWQDYIVTNGTTDIMLVTKLAAGVSPEQALGIFEARSLALSLGQAGAAVAASMGRAKLCGLLVDLAPPLAGLWLFHIARGQFSRADDIANELFNVARIHDDSDILLQAHHCAWPLLWFRGAFNDAMVHADAGLGLYDEVRHAGHRCLYHGHDPAVCALSIKAILQWLLGHPTQAMHLERDAINLARRLQHVPSLANALWIVCEAQIARADAAAVMDTATELLTLSEEHVYPRREQLL